MAGPTLSTRKELLLLYACFHLLYAASSPGDLMTDSQTRWNAAERLLDTGWVDVTPETASLYAPGRDGKLYMPWSMGQSVLLLPFVLAGRIMAALPLPLPGTSEMYGQFLACMLLFPATGALCLVLVYRIALDAGFAQQAARLAAIVLGLATMHWQHSVNSVDETQAAVCILAALWATQRVWRRAADSRPGREHAYASGEGMPPVDGERGRPARRAFTPLPYRLIACAALGVGLWFRLPSIALIGLILLLGIVFELVSLADAPARRRALLRWIAAGVIGAGPLLAAFAWFNWVRFGSPLETGYAAVMRDRLGVDGLFDTPLWFGLTGMLISPGKGIFVFNPILLLAIPGGWLLWRRDRRLALVIAAVFAVSVLLHARHSTWAGDLTWGSRYLVSQLGLLTLALLPLLPASGTKPRRWSSRSRRGAVFVGLLSLSVVIQASSVVYNYGLEFFQDRRQGLIPDGYIWRPAESQLVRRCQNLYLHAIGRPNYTSIPPEIVRPELHHLVTTPEQVERLHALHFFPFKALAVTGSRPLFAVLLVLWLTLLTLLAWVSLYWRRCVRLSQG